MRVGNQHFDLVDLARFQRVAFSLRFAAPRRSICYCANYQYPRYRRYLLSSSEKAITSARIIYRLLKDIRGSNYMRSPPNQYFSYKFIK